MRKNLSKGFEVIYIFGKMWFANFQKYGLFCSLKMRGLKGISLIGDAQWSKVVYKRVGREKPV